MIHLKQSFFSSIERMACCQLKYKQIFILKITNPFHLKIGNYTYSVFKANIQHLHILQHLILLLFFFNLNHCDNSTFSQWLTDTYVLISHGGVFAVNFLFVCFLTGFSSLFFKLTCLDSSLHIQDLARLVQLDPYIGIFCLKNGVVYT